MDVKKLKALSYQELVEIAGWAQAEIRRRDEVEHTKAWNAVVEAITNYITNYDSITVMLPDDVSEAEADAQTLDLTSTGIIVVNEGGY